MTPKQRMKTAMSGGLPDRVPVMPQICHPHAIRMLGLPFRETILDCLRDPLLKNRLTLECAKAYGVDGMRAFLPADPVTIVEDGEDAYAVDASGRRTGRVDFQGGGGVAPLEESLLRDETDLERLEVPTADVLLATPAFQSIGQIVRDAGEELFVASAPGSFTVEGLTVQRGKAQAMRDLIELPEFSHRIIDKLTQIAIQRSLALCQVGVDALYLGETFGGVVGPRHFTEFCLPYMRRLIEAVRPFGVLIYLHMCGNVTRLLELMADTGTDCIEPLDPLGGVDVADAKRRIGHRVALMGGVNTVTLACGTLAGVAAECQRCLQAGSPGGGYILASGDMLPTETAPDRVRTMIEAAIRYGAKP